jgi:hypothetical protein
MHPKTGIELRFETNFGDSWFQGMVHHINEDGTVKFVEDDDGTVHHNLDLRLETWKYL